MIQIHLERSDGHGIPSGYNGGYAEAIDLAIEVLKAEPKHGRWLWLDDVRCSICNHKLQTTGLPSYCPRCGAKMDLDEVQND